MAAPRTTGVAVPLDPAVTLRAIRSDDVDRLRRMFERCSPETIYRRFFSHYPRAPERVLQRLTTVDYVNRYAVVAEVGEEIIGVARFDRAGTPDAAEIAVCVEDAWQRRGVARALFAWILDVAREGGIARITADVQSDNAPALALLRSVLPGVEITLDGTAYAVHALI